MKRNIATTVTSRLLGVAVALGMLIAFEIGGASGLLRSQAARAGLWQFAFPFLGLIAAIGGAVLHAFTFTLERSPRRLRATFAGTSLALLASIDLIHAVNPLPRYFYFSLVLAAQLAFTFCFAEFLVLCLKIEGKWRQLPPIVATGVVSICGFAAIAGQSWLALEQMALDLSLIRDLALLFVPIVILAAFATIPRLRLDKKSRWQSVVVRLNSEEMHGPWWRNPLLTGSLGLLASIAIFGGLHLAGEIQPGTALGATSSFCLGWVGVAVFGVHELSEFTKKQMQGTVTARLASHSAKRFLSRHLTDENAWAATVGLRTTNFNIDHDPGSFLHSQLPASIMQIRNEEIQRCIGEVLGGMYMHSHVVGPRIFGAIDTELSLRPCTDTLKMFSCLYLDAGPLVERRINGLVSLLPIVDPGLNSVLGSKDIGGLIRRNLWFFHFDFGWIDQHVIHTPRSTKYDIRIDGLSSHSRYALIEHFERMGGSGNIIWLGPEARNRLLQEAPSLRSIIDPCPIHGLASSEGGPHGPDEMLMFTIRFEQLIPRLQRYFDLDTMRRGLLDFEPSADSRRMLNLLALQASKATTSETVTEVLAAITSVPWHGFKEKDNALHLILTVFNNLSRELPRGQTLQAAEDHKMKSLYFKLIDAVRSVGYPSQILHDAQISKLALRDVTALIGVASDSRHLRFHEAWLLMATSDYGRHKIEQRVQLLKFLATAGTLPRVRAERLAQIKAIDAVCSIGQHVKEEELGTLADCLGKLGIWYSQTHADADIVSLYLDAYHFLNHHLQKEIPVPSATTLALEHYFAILESTLGSSHPRFIALMSRWQELRAMHLVPSGLVAA